MRLGAGLSVILAAVLGFALPGSLWLALAFLGAGLVLLASDERLRTAIRAGWDAQVPIGRRRIPLGRVLAEGAAVIVCLAVSAAIVKDAAFGDRPVSGDHSVHYYNTWQLSRTLSGSGEIYSWSQLWFTGHPFQYLYPIGAYLWVILVHVASFGVLTLSGAYAVGFWLAYALHGYGVYWLGRNAQGRAVGLVAAVLYLTDSGGDLKGGKEWIVTLGVWPVALSLAFSTIAIALVPRLVERPAARRAAVVGLLLGAALLSHPVQLLNLPILAAVLAFAILARRDAGLLRRAAPQLLLAAAIAILIGALWLAPFLSTRDFAEELGSPWASLDRIAAGLFDGSLLETSAVVAVLGLLGSLGLLRSRNPLALFTALAPLAFFLAGSSSVHTALRLEEVFDTLRYIDFTRFAMLAKPFWFVSAAAALLAVLERSPRWLDRIRMPGPASSAKLYAVAWIVTACVSAPLLPLVKRAAEEGLHADLRFQSERVYASERQAFLGWFAASHAESDGFFRVAQGFRWYDHSFTDLGCELPVPLFKLSFTPAKTYKFDSRGMRDLTPENLRLANVRYYLTDQFVDRPQLRIVETFGGLKLYEFDGWSRDPFEVVAGTGHVELSKFGEEEVLLRADPGASGTLRLNVSPFPRWKAYRDGRSVPIGTTSPRDCVSFMTVDLLPGEYRFAFERSWIERWAPVSCALGILLAGATLIPRRGRRSPSPL